MHQIHDKDSLAVLLIEDNPGDARLIREMLAEDQRMDYQIRWIKTLADFQALPSENSFDIILLDLSLPDSSGFDTLDCIEAAVSSTPIVILTGRGDLDGKEALRRGAQDYLVKSRINPQALCRVIQYSIERKRSEDRLKRFSEELREMVDERTRDLKEAQEELIRRERLATLGRLAGGIGHELRNPLGVLSNAVYFLKSMYAGKERTLDEYLDIISIEVVKAEKIVADLLDFSRVYTVEKSRIAIGVLIDAAIERNPPPDGVEIRLREMDDVPELSVDRDQIIQVLENIITNAYQAMENSGRITFAATENKNSLCVSIHDTGCGISEEELQKIFEPLYTTKAKGIGLGLAVARKFVEANGGTLSVESTPEGGTTFTLELPCSS